MFLTELYTAMVTEEADQLAEQRRQRQVSRPAAAPSQKEIQQDAHIRMIERENQQLKGTFAALVHVLVEKHVLNDVDVMAVAQEARTAVEAS